MRARSLLFAGMLLFFLGLVAGATAQLFPNPRMAVSGHLECVLNGIFLLVVGLAWPRFKLSDKQKKLAGALLLFGTYANSALTELAAMWGTKKLTPIAGAGYDASDMQETLMIGGLGIMIIAMVGAVGLLTYSLRGDDP